MQARSISRAALMAGAVSLAVPLLVPVPAHASTATVGVKKKRMHIRAGRRVSVAGTVHPRTAGVTARLQIRSRGAWRTIDRDRTSASGRYVLRDRIRRPQSVRARVLVSGTRRSLGFLNVYRVASASWYGPGLYGNRLGCGGTLSPGRIGVAHKSLPCGSRLTLRHGTRTVRVRVIDRGPYVGGREFDLTEATAQRLGFHGYGPILTTR
jgi:rare lipoprotein A (peptidoglycan hydrolase)